MKCSARIGPVTPRLPQHRTSPSRKTSPICRWAGWQAAGFLSSPPISRASGRTTGRPRRCGSTALAMSSRATRCTPKRCATMTNASLAGRIDCELRRKTPFADPANSDTRCDRRADDRHLRRCVRAQTRGRGVVAVGCDPRADMAPVGMRDCVRWSRSAVGGAVVSTPKLHSDDELIAALERNGGNLRKTSRELGVAYSGVQKRVKRLALKGYSPAHDYTHPVPDGFKVKGVSTYYDKDGKPGGQWVKSSADAERQLAMMREAIDAMTCDLPKLPARKAKGTYLPDLMTLYPIGDAHVGMRSWLDETGANWDLKIAERVQCGAMAELVAGAPATETAAVIDLGDWLHSDGLVAQTPRSGHPLDADGRYAKIIHIGIKIIRQCIES